MTLVIGSIGVFILGVERFVDLFFLGHWSPGWSLIVLAVCVILIIPLIVVRRVPSSGKKSGAGSIYEWKHARETKCICFTGVSFYRVPRSLRRRSLSFKCPRMA